MSDQPSITCPRCGSVSYNPNDIAQKYCGRCHWWTSNPIIGSPTDEPGVVAMMRSMNLRTPVTWDYDRMQNIEPGDRVLITGGTGSLGQALVRRLVAQGITDLRVMSRDEKKQYDLSRAYPTVQCVLGDIRDPAACWDVVKDIDTVIHGASLKYVNIGETQPYEYVTTNVAGTTAIIDAVLHSPTVRSFVGISSDKACLPINTYGMTKAILERLVTEANNRNQVGDTKFTTARYGNVLGTRGSVVPFWRDRIAAGLNLPLTNPDMTRFFFTMNEAVELIDRALAAAPGTVVSKRMSACIMSDLAAVMCPPDSEVEVVGERPGEKLHEMLLAEHEMLRVNEVDGFFYLNMDAPCRAGTRPPFTSDIARRLTTDEIAELLEQSEL